VCVCVWYERNTVLINIIISCLNMVCHTQKNCHDEGAWDGWEETMPSVYVHKYYTCCRLCAQVFNWACLLCSRRACMPLPLAYACWIARGLRLLSLCAPVYVDKYTSILQCMWTSLCAPVYVDKYTSILQCMWTSVRILVSMLWVPFKTYWCFDQDWSI
jgi:hypothetical protein